MTRLPSAGPIKCYNMSLIYSLCCRLPYSVIDLVTIQEDYDNSGIFDGVSSGVTFGICKPDADIAGVIETEPFSF